MRDSLKDYIASQVGKTPFDEDTPLFSSGLLDSFVMIELITHIESQAGIRVGPMEVTLDNLDTLGRMVRFVDRKRASA